MPGRKIVGGTDSKNYVALSRNIYRFLPVRATGEDLKRLHGTNERLGMKNYEEIMRFYAQLIRNAN